MLVLLIICASFDKILVVLVAPNGKAKWSYLLFYIVNEIYEYYEARSAISLFQMKEFFSHHFRGFKLEIFDPHNSLNPIRFPTLSNKYSNDFWYDPVLCPNKIIYWRRINSLLYDIILLSKQSYNFYLNYAGLFIILLGEGGIVFPWIYCKELFSFNGFERG